MLNNTHAVEKYAHARAALHNNLVFLAILTSISNGFALQHPSSVFCQVLTSYQLCLPWLSPVARSMTEESGDLVP